MDISDRIKSLRKEKGYSQAWLAKLLSVNKHTVGVWERGVQMPGSKNICALSKVLGVSTDELLNFKKSAAGCCNDEFGIEFRPEFKQEPNFSIGRCEGFIGLSDIMEERQISRKKLAAALGVTEKTIYNWEIKGLPRLKFYQKMFELLILDIDTFNVLR